jgi:hypothetical protein
LTYPRIASTPSSPSTLDYDVDKKVDESIQSFLMTLSQIGPELLSVRSFFYGSLIVKGESSTRERNWKRDVGSSFLIPLSSFFGASGRIDSEFL